MRSTASRIVALPDTPHVERLRADAHAISSLYFGCPVYLVGGALTDPDPRDLDVVVIVPDDLFLCAYGGKREGWGRADALESLVCQFAADGYSANPGPVWRRWARDMAKWNARLTKSCHRRVDFKVQPATLAERHHAGRPRARLDVTP